MPEARDVKKVPRQWLYDVAYTIIGKPLADWVDSKITERNDKLATKQNLYINMDPKITAAFHQSHNISSKSQVFLLLLSAEFLNKMFYLASNGSSAHLLKAGSKRRRTQAEMKE